MSLMSRSSVRIWATCSEQTSCRFIRWALSSGNTLDSIIRSKVPRRLPPSRWTVRADFQSGGPEHLLTTTNDSAPEDRTEDARVAA